MKKQVYSSWAFTENEDEKAQINQELYRELIDKVKIVSVIDELTEEMKKQKACLLFLGFGYAHKSYHVVSNPHNMSTDELALVADGGNLCFGYRVEGSNIIIHTD
jgi:hypothetical protein